MMMARDTATAEAPLSSRVFAIWERWTKVVRSEEWLAVTFLPLMTSFYLLLLLAPKRDLAALWKFLALLLFGYCCTSFAFVLNTWTDRGQDQRARKLYPTTDWRIGQVILLLAILTAGCGVAVVLLVAEPSRLGSGAAGILPMLRGLLSAEPYMKKATVLTLIGVLYVAAVLYSAPPARIKERGSLGPLMIAVSEFALPQLLLFAVFESIGVVAWLFTALFVVAGLRLMLLHQILDHANDISAGVDSMVVRKGPESVGKLVFAVLVPLEVTIVVALLWVLEPRIPGSLLFGLGSVLFFVLWSRVRQRTAVVLPLLVNAPFDFYWLIWPTFLLVRGLGESVVFAPLLGFHFVISRSVWQPYWDDLKRIWAELRR